MEEDVPIEARMVTRSIANAQRKVEAHNFDIRKNLLQFDDVANDQRKVIYTERRELLESEDVSDRASAIFEDVILALIEEYIPEATLEEQWDVAGLEKIMAIEFNIHLPLQQWLDTDDEINDEILRKRIVDQAYQQYQEKEQHLGPMVMRQLEKTVMLRSLDLHWKEHLAAMDHLRQSIGLRGYAQKNPVQEYKREAFLMFSTLLDIHYRDVVSTLLTIEITAEDPLAKIGEAAQPNPYASGNLQMQHVSLGQATDVAELEAQADALAREEEGEDTAVATFVREERKVGRNEPCPCGSGKKYKVCHGKL